MPLVRSPITGSLGPVPKPRRCLKGLRFLGLVSNWTPTEINATTRMVQLMMFIQYSLNQFELKKGIAKFQNVCNHLGFHDDREKKRSLRKRSEPSKLAQLETEFPAAPVGPSFIFHVPRSKPGPQLTTLGASNVTWSRTQFSSPKTELC